MLGLAPEFLGNKKGTLEFTFYVLLLACTLKEVSSLIVYVGSRNQNTGDQAWQPSPTQPSCGAQVCILSNFRDSRADGF